MRGALVRRLVRFAFLSLSSVDRDGVRGPGVATVLRGGAAEMPGTLGVSKVSVSGFSFLT